MHEFEGLFSHWGLGHWSIGILFWIVVIALIVMLARNVRKNDKS